LRTKLKIDSTKTYVGIRTKRISTMTRMIICIPTYGHPHAVGFHTTGVSTKIDIHGYVGGQCDYSLMQSLPPELRVCIFKSDTWALMDSILDLSGVIYYHDAGKWACTPNMAMPGWFGNMIVSVDPAELSHRAKEALIRASSHEDNDYHKRYLRPLSLPVITTEEPGQ
jgi:hypothetical protein